MCDALTCFTWGGFYNKHLAETKVGVRLLTYSQNKIKALFQMRDGTRAIFYEEHNGGDTTAEMQFYHFFVLFFILLLPDVGLSVEHLREALKRFGWEH